MNDALSHQVGSEMSPVQLGLASYTFRNFHRAQLIRHLKQLNVSSINVKNVKDHLPTNPRDQVKALEDYAAAGITLHGAGGFSFSSDDDTAMRSKFEYCKRAGITMMVAGDPTLKTLPRLERFAREYDMRIAIYNHGPEHTLWRRARALVQSIVHGARMRSPLEVLEAVYNMDSRLGCCIDVGHTARAGLDLAETIRTASSRLFNVHMKDLTSLGRKEDQVPVGKGIIPVRDVFEALGTIAYKGFVDLEYEIDPDDPMPGVTQSFASIRTTLASMGAAHQTRTQVLQS